MLACQRSSDGMLGCQQPREIPSRSLRKKMKTCVRLVGFSKVEIARNLQVVRWVATFCTTFSWKNVKRPAGMVAFVSSLYGCSQIQILKVKKREKKEMRVSTIAFPGCRICSAQHSSAPFCPVLYFTGLDERTVQKRSAE